MYMYEQLLNTVICQKRHLTTTSKTVCNLQCIANGTEADGG